MTDFLDIALDYLKEHRWVAGAVGILFIILLLKNFWFLVKLLVVLALGAAVVFLLYALIGDAAKKKQELYEENKETSRLEYVIHS